MTAAERLPHELQLAIARFLRICAVCGRFTVTRFACAACGDAWCDACARARAPPITFVYLEARVPLCLPCKYYLNLL